MFSNIQVSGAFQSYITDWDYETYMVMGGYGSGKSYDTALKIVLKAWAEKRTVLVARAVFDTLRDSCFALFKEILTKADLLDEGNRGNKKEKSKLVVAVNSPMELRFPNGSRIIFRGLDNYERIKSIHGVSIVWVEECTEIKYDSYMELLGRIREPGVTLHFILTCNPVGRENWVYNMFFVHTDENGNEEVIQSPEELYKRKRLVNRLNGVYYHHSTVDDNPFINKSYKERLEGIKQFDKPLWLVARWGRFGANGLRVLPNFRIATDAQSFVNKVRSISASNHYFGLDFGFEISYNALISCCVDVENNDLYVYDEVYINHITDDKFAELEKVKKVKALSESLDKAICADAAEPKSIQFYRQKGFQIYGCKKYIGSKLQNVKKIKRFNHIYVSKKCKNTIRELRDLTYKKDRQGNAVYDEFNVDAHTLDAIAYSLDSFVVPDYKITTNSKSGGSRVA